jgi:ribose-phosphate pyrophosphokinase
MKNATFFNHNKTSLTVTYTVIGGPASLVLAKKIAKKLDAKYMESQLRTFADGESNITIPDKPKGTVIIVQSTFPPVDTNLIHAFSLISKAKQWSSRVIAIIPYLAYMRQDIEFRKGEVVTSQIVAKLLGDMCASKIIVMDIHSRIALNYFGAQIKNTSAVPNLARYFKEMRLKNPLVVSPDLFWANHAKKFAAMLDAESAALNKQRDRKTGAIHIIPSKKMDLSGRDIILLDDMISTGDSIIKATKYLQGQNCGDVYAACTHLLLVNEAEKRIKKAGVKKVIGTNTIPNKNSIIDVSGILANAVG